MVRYLKRLGHDVRVITAAPPGHPSGEDDGIIRTASLNADPRLRRLLLRHRGAAQTSPSTAGSGVVPPLLWQLIVPDPWLLTWNPYALRALRAQVSSWPADCLITSSPAESTHLLALALGPRRPAWIADLRDGWCFEPVRDPFRLPVHRAIDRRLERSVATSADLLVGVTEPIASDLAVRFHTAAVHVSNGFDPEAEVAPSPPPGFDPEALNLVHTGPLLGPRGRDPRPFLTALARVAAERPELGSRLRLLVAGRSEFDERALVASVGVSDIVRHLGYLPRPRALALQRAATALVLLTSHARSEATGKLYEYLAAGPPILAMARDNEAARILSETRGGIVVSPDDVDAIVQALRAVIDGTTPPRPPPELLTPYRYPAPARGMADAVERAIDVRRAQLPANSR
jgi:glycosyltransferase involved in cell wall biosynthesis